MTGVQTCALPIYLTPLNETGPQWLADMTEKARADHLEELVGELEKGKGQSEFLGTVMTLSPFLRETIIRNPSFIAPLVHKDISQRLNEILVDISKIDTSENIT